MVRLGSAAIGLALGLHAVVASASPFTTASPTGGALPSGVTEIGGIVLDLTGANGVRVVSQLAASNLFMGFYDDGEPVAYRGNPGTIGIQGGFTPTVLSALGGGLSEAAVRITLWDGDTGSGDFDHNANFLLLNDIAFGADGGNFSAVETQTTNSVGTALAGTSLGFKDEHLDTGFFVETDATTLADLFASLSGGQVAYKLRDDIVLYDNFFDFTRGLDGGLIDVGQGPVVTPPGGNIPEPTSLALLGGGLGALLFGRLRRRKAA